MYEVAIHADPERFLDYDKPVPANSPLRELLGEHANRVLRDNDYGGLRNDAKDALNVVKSEYLTGEGVYDKLAMLNANIRPAPGGRFIEPSRPAATDALREAGVPGIKYLDQGSRTAGDGSRNYVLFDDKLVEILRKYGVASFAALPPAVQLAYQQQFGTPPEQKSPPNIRKHDPVMLGIRG
jgi:hypothetical protein